MYVRRHHTYKTSGDFIKEISRESISYSSTLQSSQTLFDELTSNASPISNGAPEVREIFESVLKKMKLSLVAEIFFGGCP